MAEHFTHSYWRMRAEEARAHAGEARAQASHSSDVEFRRIMNGIAKSYDEMAKTAERLEKSLIVLDKSGKRDGSDKGG